MNKKIKFPLWIRAYYYVPGEKSVKGYRSCANNNRVLFDQLDRLNISKENLIELKFEDKVLSDNEVDSLFKWIEKLRREREEKKNEEPKKTKG